MTKLRKLKLEAIESSKFRGHKMAKFRGNMKSAIATCIDCKAFVMVNTRPMPNDIEIGGTAVAINCKGRE